VRLSPVYFLPRWAEKPLGIARAETANGGLALFVATARGEMASRVDCFSDGEMA
jgi:hypothetical protein